MIHTHSLLVFNHSISVFLLYWLYCFLEPEKPAQIRAKSGTMVVSGPETEEKKMKRRISNRESARRSRIKREKHIKDLIKEKSVLEKKLNEDKQKYFAIWECHFWTELKNKELRDETAKLKEYLDYLQQIIGSNYEETQNDYYNVNCDQQVNNHWQVYSRLQRIAAPVTLV